MGIVDGAYYKPTSYDLARHKLLTELVNARPYQTISLDPLVEVISEERNIDHEDARSLLESCASQINGITRITTKEGTYIPVFDGKNNLTLRNRTLRERIRDYFRS